MTETAVLPAQTETEYIRFEDYLARYNGAEGVKTEWIAGRIAVYTVTNNQAHQNIIFLLAVMLRAFLDTTQLGVLIQSGIPMFLGVDKPAREPDLMILIGENAAQSKPTYIEGAVDIVIEVVSPESAARDRGEKYLEYEAAGVREYWLIDPLRQSAEWYRLASVGEARVFQPILPEFDGKLHSQVLPRFTLNAALLWQPTLPTLTEIIALVQAMVANAPH